MPLLIYNIAQVLVLPLASPRIVRMPDKESHIRPHPCTSWTCQDPTQLPQPTRGVFSFSITAPASSLGVLLASGSSACWEA